MGENRTELKKVKGEKVRCGVSLRNGLRRQSFLAFGEFMGGPGPPAGGGVLCLELI